MKQNSPVQDINIPMLAYIIKSRTFKVGIINTGITIYMNNITVQFRGIPNVICVYLFTLRGPSRQKFQNIVDF